MDCLALSSPARSQDQKYLLTKEVAYTDALSTSQSLRIYAKEGGLKLLMVAAQ